MQIVRDTLEAFTYMALQLLCILPF